VDPFTKFVEAGPVEDLRAATITAWFHSQVVCRYGVPRWVRCDRGTEFRGDFEAYCCTSGIIVRRTSADNPRANGQVERYNLMLRQGLRRMVVGVPGAEWWHVLPDVLRALRVLPHSVTGLSPFALVFKQHPRWHDRLELTVAEPVMREPTAEEEEALFAAQSTFWDVVRGLVTERLQANDLKMIRAYRRNKLVADRDPRVIFKPGDRVLLRRRQPGKMKTRAEGPWTFLRYKNTAGWVAIVEGLHGRKLEVSATNLIPLKGRQHLPTLDPALVWDDPPAEERYGAKRKRTAPP
jgi:hypothetical protein